MTGRAPDPWLAWDAVQPGRGVYQCARAALASREARLRREGTRPDELDGDPVVASLRMMCGVGPMAKAADELRAAEGAGAMGTDMGYDDTDMNPRDGGDDETRAQLERRIAEIVSADLNAESPEAYRAARAAALREIRREESPETPRAPRRTGRWAWRKLTTTERADVVDEMRRGGSGGTAYHLTHSAVRSLLTGEGSGSSMLSACGLYSARVLSEEAFADVTGRDDGHACGLCRRALRRHRRTSKPTKIVDKIINGDGITPAEARQVVSTLRGTHLRATMRAVLRTRTGADLATVSVHKLCARPWWQAVELDGAEAMLDFVSERSLSRDLSVWAAGVRRGDREATRAVRRAYLEHVRAYWPTWGPTEVVEISNRRRWRLTRETESGGPSVLESALPTQGVGDDGVQRRELIVPIPPWVHVHEGAAYVRGPLDEPATWERPVRGSGMSGIPQAPTSVVYVLAHESAATWSKSGGFSAVR